MGEWCKLNDKEILNLTCGGQAAWVPGGVVSYFNTAEMEELCRGITPTNLFKEAVDRVERLQYIWQINKCAEVVKNKLTFHMKLWSCKKKKEVG